MPAKSPPTPPPSSPGASATGRANRRTDTGPERLLRSALHRRGLRFRKDHPLQAGGMRVRADIAFPRDRVAVFCDGCFWHGCPRHFIAPRANADFWRAKIEGNRNRDRRVDDALMGEGWTVLRFWEHTAPDEAARLIAQQLGRGGEPGGAAP